VRRATHQRQADPDLLHGEILGVVQRQNQPLALRDPFERPCNQVTLLPSVTELKLIRLLCGGQVLLCKLMRRSHICAMHCISFSILYHELRLMCMASVISESVVGRPSLAYNSRNARSARLSFLRMSRDRGSRLHKVSRIGSQAATGHTTPFVGKSVLSALRHPLRVSTGALVFGGRSAPTFMTALAVFVDRIQVLRPGGIRSALPTGQAAPRR
jgi:hypothetical protein